MMTSSREEGDLLKGYGLGVNAYVVKPMKFQAFIAAVKQTGTFWAVTNEPPPAIRSRFETVVPEVTMPNPSASGKE
jgi:hypothetical protein